ncbi:hypothetical protein SUGI_0175430 [Cryptomeria japonica]|nr:hypothetical protein SUGI_0175430 [Cryptomeria japonica]
MIQGVIAMLDPMSPNPSSGFIVVVFDVEAVGNRKKVAEALSLYREGLGELSLIPFSNFVGLNGDLFSTSQMEMINVLSEGVNIISC